MTILRWMGMLCLALSAASLAQTQSPPQPQNSNQTDFLFSLQEQALALSALTGLSEQLSALAPHTSALLQLLDGSDIANKAQLKNILLKLQENKVPVTLSARIAQTGQLLELVSQLHQLRTTNPDTLRLLLYLNGKQNNLQTMLAQSWGASNEQPTDTSLVQPSAPMRVFMVQPAQKSTPAKIWLKWRGHEQSLVHNQPVDTQKGPMTLKSVGTTSDGYVVRIKTSTGIQLLAYP